MDRLRNPLSARFTFKDALNEGALATLNRT